MSTDTTESKAKPAAKPKPAPKAKPAAPKEMLSKKPAGRFKLRLRHFYLIASFLLLVALPIAALQYYFSVYAKPQYASTVGFVVRNADTATSSEVLGGIVGLASTTGNDADILYEFIYSQELVRRIDETLDLRALFNRVEDDPIFALGDADSIEDLLRYWPRMVRVSYDANTGLLELRVLAFDPVDAQKIAQAILEESSQKINELSAQAREDATRQAQETLDKSVGRLKEARKALTTFRNTYQIVDPSVTLQERSGLLNSLQQQLAEARINYKLLAATSRSTDPRLEQAQQRITEIQALIDEERQEIGQGAEGNSGEVFSALFGEYEGLTVEREFAERTYLNALQNFDNALTQADRQSRYLSAYILPTLAESAEFPQRWILSGIVALFLFFFWAILCLVAYSLRDRR